MVRNIPLMLVLALLVVAALHDTFVADSDPQLRMRQGAVLNLEIMNKNAEEVRRLLKAGADPNQITPYGSLPLVAAMGKNHVEIFDALIDAGAEVNKIYHFSQGGSVHGWQPIHFAAEGSGDLSPESSWAFIEKLLAHGADVNASTYPLARTPLHFAAWQGSAPLVDHLLAAGADPHRMDKMDFSPLFFAAKSGDMATFKRLMVAGADIHAAGPGGQYLLHAASGHSEEIVRYLLAAGLDPNARVDDNSTPLHKHAMAQDPGSMRLLLEAGADPHVVNDKGDQPLHLVPGRNDQSAEAIQILLGAGVAVDVRNGMDNTTPLHRAAHSDDETAVQALIDHGADANAVDNKGWTVFHHAIDENDTKHDAIPILAAHKADINRLDRDELVTPLYMASQRNNDSGAKALLEAGADPMARAFDGNTALHALKIESFLAMVASGKRKDFVDVQNMFGETPLFHALRRQKADTIRSLVDNMGADINHRDNTGETPMHQAVRSFEQETMEVLLSYKPKINAQDNLGNTPLHFAVRLRHPDIIRLLLKAGADARIANNQGITPLQLAQSSPPLQAAFEEPDSGIHDSNDWKSSSEEGDFTKTSYLLHDAQRMAQAVRDGDVDGVRKLLGRGVSPDVEYKEGDIVLNLALLLQKREIVTLLLNHGARADLKVSGWLPLDMAVDWNDKGVIEELLQHGADINAHDRSCYKTPLQLSILRGAYEAFLFLVEKGARIDEPCCNDGSLLHTAAWSDKFMPPFLEKLLAMGIPVNDRDLTDMSPLDAASRNGNLETITYLIDHGGDLVPPPGLPSPLHHAAHAGHPEVISLLVARGADINARDGGGLTPLHWAIYSNSPDTVRRLLALGADRNIQDKAQRTPLGLAKAFGHGALDTVRVLAQEGAPLGVANH